jgi:NADH:ubiquinone oxidoreductase subunit K
VISERKAALRRTTLHLVLGVVLLDAVAIGIYYLADFLHRPQQTQIIFVAVWTAATAITVAVLLRRVRLARKL